jgi:hypothetical protein
MSRLSHGECIPVSSAIRLRGMAAKTSFIAFGVCPASAHPPLRQIRPARNTNSIDRPGPNRWLASDRNSVCSGPPQCYSSSFPVSFIGFRFERVDNLGAYSIPSGDRPSHPVCSIHSCIGNTMRKAHFASVGAQHRRRYDYPIPSLPGCCRRR